MVLTSRRTYRTPLAVPDAAFFKTPAVRKTSVSPRARSQVDSERLVRVYGALMFNVGKILRTPEVVRVFIGSFWDEPLRHAE